MSWLVKSNVVFCRHIFLVCEIEITQLPNMNFVYFRLVLKECKISYSNGIANVSRPLIR